MMAMAIQTTTKKMTMTRNEYLFKTVDKDGNEVSMGNYAVYHAGTGTDFSLLDRNSFIVDKDNLKYQLQLAGDDYFDVEKDDLAGLSWEQIDSSAERIAPTHLLIEAWEQALELLLSIEEDEDLLEVKRISWAERAKQIMAMLHDFVPEDMSKYEASF